MAAAVEHVDGYVEMITAFVRARRAAAEMDAAKEALVQALRDLADGVAHSSPGEGLADWAEVEKTRFGDIRMPNTVALELGRFAAWSADNLEDFDDSDLERLENLTRQSFEKDGPMDGYRAKLEALFEASDAG